MPVISISTPRNTNSGTASRIRLLIPSSMRETTTVSGVEVVVARYASVASPKAKPIGTDSSTPAPSSSTKKTTRFQLPSPLSTGQAQCRPSARAPRTAAANTTSFQPSRSSRASAVTTISAAPTGIAAARNVLCRPSAGVSMNHSSLA